jgi:hypothetical protein
VEEAWLLPYIWWGGGEGGGGRGGGRCTLRKMTSGSRIWGNPIQLIFLYPYVCNYAYTYVGKPYIFSSNKV